MVDLVAILLTPFVWALNWMYQILVASNAFGIFVGFFSAGAVIRYLIKPLIGKNDRVGDD